uniref:Actin-associated protein FAM107A n=1 Tax=Poecilia reticulata TaxID=8081 RepID=A0A3P9QBY9_POERE
MYNYYFFTCSLRQYFLYMPYYEDEDLIKPKKLLNPVKASRSHQELHRELLSSCRRGGSGVETKPELQRVLESRKRDQLIRQRKQEEEAHRKISPLEAELLKRHMKLEEGEHGDSMQKDRESNPEPSCCKAAALPAAPLCSPAFKHYNKNMI